MLIFQRRNRDVRSAERLDISAETICIFLAPFGAVNLTVAVTLWASECASNALFGPAVSTGDEVIKGKSNYICCKGAARTLPLSSRRETPLPMRRFVISQQLRGFKRGLDF